MFPSETLKVILKGRKEGLIMVIYEVYVRREHDGREFLGALPERRTNEERVNSESIVNWAKSIDETIETSRVSFSAKNI